jgi:hypothetical protein
VRKRRRRRAPVLIWLGGPLSAVLGTGVRVLRRGEWEERERRLYAELYGGAVRVEADGALALPVLPGATLARLLDDAVPDTPVRTRAIALAVAALADLHRRGLTHADAMAENVMVDLDGDVARWFDFETVHDPRRPVAWRRADDLRALLSTCLLRSVPAERAGVLRLVLDVYADDEAARALAASVASVLRRPLALHLGQAALSLHEWREMAALLNARPGAVAAGPAG